MQSGELACINRDDLEVNVLKAEKQGSRCFGELAALGLTTERTVTIVAKCPTITYLFNHSMHRHVVTGPLAGMF